MKAVFAIAMVVIGLIVLMGIYPSFAPVINGVDTTNFSDVLTAYVDNLWWIVIVLGVIAAASAWWLYR